VLIRVSALASLAERLRAVDGPPRQRWDAVDRCFRSWIDQPDLSVTLKNHLSDLPAEETAAVKGGSRETTTHFAWCLRDQPDEEFTFWLHEYKPQRDWRAGYADSVHNHRYHFCTTLVRGAYLHERYGAELDPDTGMITDVTLERSSDCEVGATAMLLADEFHRIPKARDDTMTFLVKSRQVTTWSLSFDPETRTAHRHVPIESRLADLANRM